MKQKLSIIPILLFIVAIGNAQENMFSKMIPKQRDSILIETATKALLIYAPDYYREYKKPEIILKKTFPNKSSGRLFYEVTFLYDPQKEKYLFDYIAKVYIWADNGKAFIIKFMNEWRLHIEELEKKGDSTIMPFFVPRVGKGTPLPVDSSKNVPRKFKVYK